MKLRKLFLAAVVLMTISGLVVSCSKKETGEKPRVTIWASGSDNVRIIFEKLVEEFNKDPEYNRRSTAALQFMPTGGGTQAISARLLAAYTKLFINITS